MEKQLVGFECQRMGEEDELPPDEERDPNQGDLEEDEQERKAWNIDARDKNIH